MSNDLPFETAGPREYGIASALDVQTIMDFEGQRVFVPARNRAKGFDKARPSQLMSAVGQDGRVIPGTLVIRDIYENGPGGVRELKWDAAKAARYWFGKDGKSGYFAKKGLFLFSISGGAAVGDPRKSSDFTAAEKRYKTFRYNQAQQIVAKEMNKRELFKKTGKLAPPPDSDFARAADFLENHVPESDVQKGAFRCLLCGREKNLYRDFERHAKRVHPDDAVAKILQVDEELAADQDPNWAEAEELSKQPLKAASVATEETIDDEPPVPDLRDAPPVSARPTAPPTSLEGDFTDEELDMMTKPEGEVA